MPLRGVIFDLDGTLVDSGLDFDAMRREMGLIDQRPILETLQAMDAAEAARHWRVVERHELDGVQRATAFAGAREFLHDLRERGIHRGILTRNSRASALATLARLKLEVDGIVAREDAPAKPDPAGVLRLCQAWNVAPRNCVMMGDFRFDIEAGRNAGTQTVLFTGAGKPHGLPAGAEADLVLASFMEVDRFWRWIAQIDLGPEHGSC